MFKMTLAEVAKAAGGVVLQGDPAVVVERVSTDSRQVRQGDLYIALRGQRFDGHDFVAEALRAGASAALVMRDLPFPEDLAVIRVDDTIQGLQALARHNRQASGIPMVAVTGSTGKTTTKDMLTCALSAGFRVLATKGNLNNEIGLPLTLLEIDPSHQAAVVEMGMRGRGQIKELAAIAQPSSAVITNIGETHVELLGSVEEIARAKSELLDFVPATGFALLHAESPYLAEQADRCRGKVIFFGESEGADIRLLDYRPAEGGSRSRVELGGREYVLKLPVSGRHNAINALAALGTAVEMGIDPEAALAELSRVSLSPMRQALIFVGGVAIINDAYNANPASMRAALSVLKETADHVPAIAVLGNMFELGEHGVTGHYEVGQTCARLGVDCLVTVGDLARAIAEGAIESGMAPERVWSYLSKEEALERLRQVIVAPACVLVKGSRGMQMEDIVTALSERLGATGVKGP